MNSTTGRKKRHTSRRDGPALALRSENTDSLTKRFEGGRFSFYDAGLGACGTYNSNSDFIVALNAAQWDGGSHCGDSITITIRGKTTQATIMDRCPGCPWGGLDFSRGLFNFFASESEGILQGSWDFGSPPPLPPPPPPPPPTTTWTPESTSESTSSTSSSSSSTSSESTSTAEASPTAAPGDVIAQFNLAFDQLANLASAAHSATA